MTGSVLAFLSIYTARLGATVLQIGLLTAGPAVVNLLVSLPAGRYLERRSLTRTAFIASIFQRFGYLLLILMPSYFSASRQISAMIAITVLMSLPGALYAISFNAGFPAIVPADWRAEVVGKRNAVLAVSTTISTLLSGLLLDRIAFPINYQVVFGIGLFGAMMSSYHLGKLHLADPQAPVPAEGGFSNGLAAFGRRLRNLELVPLRIGIGSLARLDLLRGRLGLFMASYLIFYTFQFVCVPLFPLGYVDVLHLSDGWISLGSGLFYTTMFLISLRLKHLAARFGHHRLLAASAMAFATYPLLIGLAYGPVLYWLASFLGGIIYGVVSASLLNRLMEVVPEQERASGMAYHNLALNLGILAGSLLGPLLGDLFGIRGGLLASSALRFLAGVLIVFWG